MKQESEPVVTSPEGVSFENTAIAFSSRSDAALRKMYWLFASMNNNFLVNTGTRMLKWAFQIHFPFVKTLVKHTVFEHFCGGETIEDCEPTIRRLWDFHIGTILDYSVEGAHTDEGFEATTQEIMRTIEKAAGNPAIPFSVFKITGIATTDLLQKVQNNVPLSPQETVAFQHVRSRLERICSHAYEHQVRLFIDAEETWIQEAIDTLAYEMMEKYNRTQVIVYNTYQMYRWDMLENLTQAYAAAEAKGYMIGAKLVRGAYMEKERRTADEENRRDLIQPTKESTDRDFDAAVALCLRHYPHTAICVGTHNEKSTYYTLQLMQQYGIPPQDTRVFFAQLYGMSDNLSYNLAHAGYHVAKYVPYGPVESVMPYLFRRASENTAIAGQSSREFNLIKKEVKRRKENRTSS